MSTDIVFAVPTLKGPNFKVETVATGLDFPTSMAYMGDKTIGNRILAKTVVKSFFRAP